MKINNTQVFGLLLLLGLFLRFFSFFPSIINHDESTYIVISDAILNGRTYFIDFVDTKPIGIFLVFALLQKIVGSSIFMLRVASTFCLVLTAFLLFKTKLKIGDQVNGAIASAVIYILINSIFTFYGVSPNTEIYFNLFTILAILLISKEQEGRSWLYFLSGLCLGIGFMIKYVVLFDALAIALFLLTERKSCKKSFGLCFGNCWLMALGAAIPISIIIAIYNNLGALDAFGFYTFEVSKRYPQKSEWTGYLIFIADYFLRFFPVTFFFFFALRHPSIHQRIKSLTVFWSVLVLLVILLPGKWFGHYFIHFSLPFSFLAGSFFSIPNSSLPKWLRGLFQPRIGYSLIGLLILTNFIFQKIDYYDKVDYPKQIAQFLTPKLEPEDRIYVSGNYQILYHLLDKESPITYVHPSLFWEDKHIAALEVDVKDQVERITNNPPRYIIWRKDPMDDRLTVFVETNYHVIAEFNRDLIYLRNE